MKQVVQDLRTGRVQILEVPAPQLRDGGALVATQFSVISPGTERSKLELGRKNLVSKARARPDLARQVVEKARRDGLRETYRSVKDRLASPAALGYSASGVVLATGRDCPGISPGDLVACAGAEYASHREVNFVPKHLLARVHQDVMPEQAAYGTLGAIALHGVRQADVRLGDRVAVIGLGVIGLLTVQIAQAAGAHVLGIDVDSEACALAARFGAARTAVRSDSVVEIVSAFTQGIGVDAVVVCAASPTNDPIDLAGQLSRDRGTVVVVGATAIDVPRELYYSKELQLRLSRSYGPGRYDRQYEEHGHDYPIGYVRWTEQRNLSEFLALVAQGRVDTDALTTHRFPVDQAVEAYALISDPSTEDQKVVGVLLEYPDALNAEPGTRVMRPPPLGKVESAPLGVGVLGAGSFATRILLPALKADNRVELVGIATSGALSAAHAADRFGFGYAAGDPNSVIHDQEVDLVVVATHHDSHASLTAQAIDAGKAVFCEKPLAVTWEELEHVAESYVERPVPLMVGFNRRFSRLAGKLRSALPPGVPRAIVCRVNAGPLPNEHWANDRVLGGGRLVGELCHFLDLACFFAEGRPIRVGAEALTTGQSVELRDTAVVQVAFADGSIASIQYLANGDPALPKERIEVFCGGIVGLIDDFRALEIARHGRRTRTKGGGKGHRAELQALIDVATGTPTEVMRPEDVFWSSAVTLQAVTSLAVGRPLAVDLPAALGGLGAYGGDAASRET